MLSIISIDIGLKNLSICKEYFDYDKAKTIISPKKRYNKLGEAHDELKDYINTVSCCGQTVFLDKVSLGEKKDMFNNKAFVNLIDYFDELAKKDIFRDVNIILIEKQLKINGVATTIMHHLHSWFLINFRTFKKVILYPSKNKTRILGAPLKVELEDGKTKKVDKAFRKKWSCIKTHDILTLREDEENLDLIFKKNKSKADDLSDVIIQALSYNVQKLLK